jgi:hypothetical protein
MNLIDSFQASKAHEIPWKNTIKNEIWKCTNEVTIPSRKKDQAFREGKDLTSFPGVRSRGVSHPAQKAPAEPRTALSFTFALT